jgi:hypothetical protein
LCFFFFFLNFLICSSLAIVPIDLALISYKFRENSQNYSELAKNCAKTKNFEELWQISFSRKLGGLLYA